MLSVKRCYKLFRLKDNQLYPLYVLANEPIPVGVWLEAKEGIKASDGKHVKSRLGALSFRPGWHCSSYPVATHIGKKKNKEDKLPSFRPKNQVWAECEVNTNTHYEDYKSRKAIPTNGYYRFKTNPNMTGDWIITSDIKVNKILTDKEVYKINSATGIHDLPRE
jgi:hypothetical protein